MRLSTILMLLGIEHAGIAVMLLLVPAVTWRPVLLAVAVLLTGIGIGCGVVAVLLEPADRQPLVERHAEAQDHG